MVKPHAHSTHLLHCEVYLFLICTAKTWGKDDMSNVELSFLLSSMYLISVLHPGSITSHLESLALVKVFLCMDSCSN